MDETLTASRQKSVTVNAPLLGLNVVGNGLDQIAVGSAHADPERKEAVVVGLTGLGQDESGLGFTDERVVGDGPRAERRAHGGFDGDKGHGGKSSEDLARRRHLVLVYWTGSKRCFWLLCK